MPLEAEGSYVADSTLSTSPQRERSTSPPIIRAARTYGRKRSPLPALDASSSPKPAEERPHFKPSRKIPRDTEESIPSTSDNEAGDGGDTESDSDSSELQRTSREFVYGDWRKGLEDIDKEFDTADSAPGPVRKADGATSATSSFGFGTPSLLSNDDNGRSTSPSLLNDIFGSSPADRSRPGSSKPDAGSDDDDEDKPLIPKKRPSRKPAVQDSDSEVEQPTTSPPVGTSPSAGPTLSPGSRRASETPPTSDNGMPAAKLQRKGKGRTSFDRNRSVPQLELQDVNEQKASQTKKSKAKKPSKKEEIETIKDRARINIDRQYKVQAAHRPTEKYSKTALLADLAGGTGTSLENIPASDPINIFSSQGEATNSIAPFPFPAFRTPSPTPGPIAGPSKPALPEIPALEDDDEELPSVLSVFQGVKKTATASSAKEELRKRKLELLKKQQPAVSKPVVDDDDDLEVVDSSRAAAVERLENQHASKAGKKDVSRTRKQHLALAGVRPSKPTIGKGKGKKVEAIRREDFDQQVLMKAQKEARAITKRKEDEWKAMGGSVRKEAESGVKSEDIIPTLAAHALEAVEESARRGERFEASDSEEDSDDGEYNPDQRGSASPEPDAMDEDEDEENKEHADEDVAMGDEQEEETLVEDPDSSENVRPRAGRRRVIASDDEDEENDENASPSRPGPRQPFSALGGRGDNDMEIVLARRSPSTDGLTNDEGTDKENDTTAIRSRQVRFDSPDFDENATLSLDLSQPRRPLQEISSSAPDTPKPLDLRTNLTQLFEAQLRTPQPSPGPSFPPLLGGALGSKGSEGFSQFTQSDRTLTAGSSSGDLSALFDATTQKLNEIPWSPERGGLLAEAFVEKPSQPNSPKKGLARSDSLGLTQDLAAERMLRIKETQMRQADAVFEKEQEYLLGAAFEPSPKPQKEKLYVNEYGFLTQTRPNGEAEEYEFHSPSQIPGTRARSVLQTPLDKGIPLTEPSTFDNLEGGSTPTGPLRRLRKRDTSPTERLTTSNEKRPRDAYEILREGAKGKEARGKRRKLDAREYVVGEAEESDDEGGFWGIKKKKQDDDEEDEDGEDLDRTLETLVDDHDMDDATLAEHLVREKYKEEEALADKKIEEEAQAIIDGRRRTRRKNRDLMGEGSDDESDDEENEERRRRMARRMKKRDDVEKLENNPLTKAFADTYQSTVLDDDQEFAHLGADDTQGVLDQLSGRRGEEDEYEEDEEAEVPEYEDEETQPRAMDPFEVHQKFREMRQKRGSSPVYDEEDGMDLTDTTWMDSMDGEEETRVAVKTIKTVAKKPYRSGQNELDPSALDDGFEDGNLMSNKRPDERHQQQGQVWAKREGRNRNTATARSVGAAAVTGLAKAKSGGGSLRTGAKVLASGGAAGEKPRPAVKKAESVLISRLGDKSSRFTS